MHSVSITDSWLVLLDPSIGHSLSESPPVLVHLTCSGPVCTACLPWTLLWRVLEPPIPNSAVSKAGLVFLGLEIHSPREEGEDRKVEEEKKSSYGREQLLVPLVRIKTVLRK